MVATTESIQRRLHAGDGLLYRYSPEDYQDGLPGGEGAFLLCSFWLVNVLALQNRTDEAEDLYARLCNKASPLGLLAEQIDPATGTFLGNFPQGLSHIGLISSGIAIAKTRHQVLV
jgi:GH15 family glucan-1,4-alpha-glucosidase